ncbi:TetR-like C-terminal domain-containing protein [Microbispora sitophila]|uniref:TetR-like C-terminal domain-containing protein n=1 Tax=Microbispora sitophila TaxID=2771537 RepID=UPI00384F7357
MWIASITIVESRIAAIPPTTSAISAFFTCGDSFASVVLLAALEHYRNSHPVDVPDTGTLRGDLLAALTGMGEARAAFFAIAAAAAFSGLLADTGLTPAQVRDRIMGDQRLSRVRTIYQRAHDRGEIDLERIPSAVLAMPFDLVRHDLLMDLEPLKPTRIRSIVDELFLPLVHNHHNGPGSA